MLNMLRRFGSTSQQNMKQETILSSLFVLGDQVMIVDEAEVPLMMASNERIKDVMSIL